MMEGAFPEVALDLVRHSAVSACPEPFAMLGVLKMTEGPVVHLLVHFGITWFSSLLVSVDCRNGASL